MDDFKLNPDLFFKVLLVLHEVVLIMKCANNVMMWLYIGLFQIYFVLLFEVSHISPERSPEDGLGENICYNILVSDETSVISLIFDRVTRNVFCYV